MAKKNGHTAPIQEEDEETEICPVCDGQCTCQPPQPTFERASDHNHHHHHHHGHHGHGQNRNNNNNNNRWVIHSRKKSVGLTDDEDDMDVDTDDDDDNGTESDDDEEDTQVDGGSSTDTRRRRKYLRLGADWTLSSSSDESSFDADIFFRYLYDSSSSSSSSGDEGGESTLNLCAQGGDDSDADTQVAFDLAESWDGGVVFTNGNGDARGEFGFMGGGSGSSDDRPGIGRGRRKKKKKEKKPPSGSGNFEGEDDLNMDLEMTMTMTMNTSGGGSSDGYVVEDGSLFDEESEGSGDTTDEDLVGPDMLPNERAMRLFRLPSSMWAAVGTVDPLSLFKSSSNHGTKSKLKDRALSPRTPSPTPTTPPASSASLTGSTSRTPWPRKGVFVLPDPPVSGGPPERSITAQAQAVVVIGEDGKGADVPSPHPRRRTVSASNRLSCLFVSMPPVRHAPHYKPKTKI